MKVALLSKALVHNSYRSKCAALAALPDIDLTVLVPASWNERGAWRTVAHPSVGDGYDLRVLPIAFDGHHHVHFFPGIGDVLEEIEPDVFHVDEEPFNFAAFHAMAEGRKIGTAMVFFALATIDRRLPPPFGQFQRRCFAWSAQAIAGAHGAVDVLRARGYDKRIDVIPQFGVSPERFAPCERQADRPFTIGYFGRLVEAKGVHVLLRAVARLRGRWRLAVVGQGSARSDLGTLADQLGIGDRLSFRPPVDSDEVPRVIHEFDVVAVPSLTTPHWSEQFGRVIIEAMACGVAVVASDSGEIPNVAGDAAMVVPENDAHALAAALQRLLDDPGERSRLADLGRRRVLERYTDTVVASAYADVYRSIAG